MSLIAALGVAGIVAIEASYVPQLLRLYRVKRSDEVSVLFPTLNVVGRVLALIYALAIGQPIFVTSFVIGILLRGTFLAQVIWYQRPAARRSRASDPPRAVSAPGAVPDAVPVVLR